MVVLDDMPGRPAPAVIDLDHEMTFNPGRYVMDRRPGKDVTRTYSMANPPGEPGRIELQIRRTPGGLGTDGVDLQELLRRRHVQLSGPYGRFFHREARTEPAILIGGGTGLAPLEVDRHVLETACRSACTSIRVPGRRPTCTTLSSMRAGGGARRAVHLPALPVRRAVGRPAGHGHRRGRRRLRDLLHTAYLCAPPRWSRPR